MEYTKINPALISAFEKILGKEFVLYDRDALEKYAHDETEDLKYFPEVVLKPGKPEEISSILKICNEHCVPVTPRGAGTGLSGAALPVYGGVLLSVERMNR